MKSVSNDKVLRWILIVGCAIALITHVVPFARFTVDDAFIAYRYAENFAKGNGIVFNLGERVEGYSNFLWVMTLGLLKKGGLDVILSSKLLGLLSLLSILVACYLMVRDLTQVTLYPAGFMWLLVTSFELVFFAVTGMETVFFAALLIWGGFLFHRNDCNTSLGLALVSVAIALTRPEGVLFFPALVVFDIMKHRRLSNKLFTAGVVFVSSYAVFLLWRYSYYGYLLPNTFYAKPPKISSNLPVVISGFDDIYRYVASTGGPLLFGLTVLVIVKSKTREKVYPMLPILAVVLTFQFYSGGDWMESYRYLVPMLPAYLVIGVFGLWWLLNRMNLKRKRLTFLAGITFLGLFNIGESASFYFQRDKYPNFVMTSEDLIPAAQWVGEHYPSDYTITCWRIGALAYYSRMDLIDTMWGLTDEYIAHSKYKGEWTNEAQQAYLNKRNPELIMIGAPRRASLENLIQVGGRTYKLVRHFRQGSGQWWVLYERNGLPERFK